MNSNEVLEVAVPAWRMALSGYVGGRPPAESVLRAMPWFNDRLSQEQKEVAIATVRWAKEKEKGAECILSFDLHQESPINFIRMNKELENGPRELKAAGRMPNLQREEGRPGQEET
jgi:hypothetical protein